MTKKDANNAVAELQAFGFGAHEARAYIALLQQSPATAYEVAKLAGIPRANAYAVLDSLAEKRVIRPVSKSPVRFTPVDPEALLSRIAEQARQRAEKLTPKLRKLSELSGDKDYVWPLEGEFDVSAKFRSMIEHATRHIWIKSKDRYLRPHAEALRHASERGIQVLIILFGDTPSEFTYNANCTVLLHEGSGAIVGDADTLVTVTRDFEEGMMASLGEDAYGSYTTSPPVVSLADTMIRHEIYMAEIFGQFSADIERVFGPSLYEIRKRLLPDHQVRSLEQMIQPGKFKGQQH